MDYENILIRKISDFYQKFAKIWNLQKLHIADIIVRKHSQKHILTQGFQENGKRLPAHIVMFFGTP